MSILYQALSRAARENARRSTTGTTSDSGTGATTPERASGTAARLRNFTAFSFRPRRSNPAGRSRLVILGVVLAALVAGWLLVSSLSDGNSGLAEIAAEIPVVSDLAALVGFTPEPIYYQPAGEQAAGLINEPEPVTDIEPVSAESTEPVLADADEALMLTPPPALPDESGPTGAGIEFDMTADTADGVAEGEDLAGNTGNSATTTEDASPTVAEAGDPAGNDATSDTVPASTASGDGAPAATPPDEAPAALLPAAAPETDSLHPTDAPPAEARETLEETLQRLANERGFTDLAPPVDINRTADAPAGAATDTPPDDPSFSITIDDRPEIQQASFEAAYSSLLAGNTEGALNLYLDVLKDDPDNTFALFGLASTLQRIGWLAEARATYEELLAIEPDNRGALANMMTLISQEAPEQALANLGSLYEINPGFSPIPAQMAMLYAGQGDYDQAIRFLKLASDLSPENLMYVYNLAIIHDRLGDHQEARTLYEQVLSAAEIRDVSIPLEAVRQRVSYLKKL